VDRKAVAREKEETTMKPESSQSQGPRLDVGNTGFPLILAVILCSTLVAFSAMSSVLARDAVLPALVSLLFGSAAVAGLIAIMRGRNTGAAMFDVAGVLTFVGIVVAVSIEPDQMVRLMAPEPGPG
jgi:hypothetical protein